jgi:hypothetical protein
MNDQTASHRIRNEVLVFAASLLVGLFALPVAIYAVGHALFNEFGGGDFGDFYAAVQTEIWSFAPVVWFLVLSPYLVITTLRFTFRLYRKLQPV